METYWETLSLKCELMRQSYQELRAKVDNEFTSHYLAMNQIQSETTLLKQLVFALDESERDALVFFNPLLMTASFNDASHRVLHIQQHELKLNSISEQLNTRVMVSSSRCRCRCCSSCWITCCTTH